MRFFAGSFSALPMGPLILGENRKEEGEDLAACFAHYSSATSMDRSIVHGGAFEKITFELH